jgi:outer membrane protein, heavy metal efflux system
LLYVLKTVSRIQVWHSAPVWSLALFAVLISWSNPALVSAQTEENRAFPASPLLDDFLAWGRQQHPSLIAADARIESLRRFADGQGSLPDLRLAWGEYIVPVETRVGPQQRMLSISQSVPWPGTLGLRKAAGTADADAERSRFRSREITVQRQIRAAWYNLALAQVEARLVGDHLSLSRQMESILRAGYEAGTGRYAEVLQAQMEVGRMERRAERLHERMPVLASRLYEAAGFETRGPLPLADLPEPAGAPHGLPDRGALLDRLEMSHPDLAAMNHREDGQRLRLDLAHIRKYPELTLGLDYIMTGSARMPDVQDSGRDPVVARVAVNLPLWGGRVKAEKEAAASRVRGTVADRRTLRNELIVQLDEFLFRLKDAQRDVALHDEILLPPMEQIVQVTQADFAAARAEFSTLVTVSQSLLQLELSRWESVHNAAQARNDLAALLDLPLNLQLYRKDH